MSATTLVFTSPPRMMTLVPWSLTLGFLAVWGVGVFTANRMGGLVNGFLIAGAVMMFISLVLGRKTIS